MTSETEEVKPIECDCCGETGGDINADGEHDNVYDCVITLTQQRDEARREIATLRAELAAVREQLRLANIDWANCAAAAADHAAEADALRHRAETAERERDAFRKNFLWWKNAAKEHRSALESERSSHRLTKRTLEHRAERMEIDHRDALDAYRQMYESERDRAERMARVVEALREPSAAVLNAAFVNLYPGCFVEERTEHLTPEIRYAIRAAVAAAERETSTETSHD